jgi:cytoskeletal protein RodZ
MHGMRVTPARIPAHNLHRVAQHTTMEPASTFGPRLRQERERRQISLTSIAENTKISRSLLEALERDDVSRWPTGIFRRSFVRAYASAIGLDADEIVKEFAERFPDPSAPPIAPPPVPQSAVQSSATRQSSPDRIDFVLRISVPRSWVSWLTWAIPGRQSM